MQGWVGQMNNDIPSPIRATNSLLAVLAVFRHASRTNAELRLHQIVRATQLSSDNLFGILRQLETAGWITRREDETSEVDKPRFWYYVLTSEGSLGAEDLLRNWTPPQRVNLRPGPSQSSLPRLPRSPEPFPLKFATRICDTLIIKRKLTRAGRSLPVWLGGHETIWVNNKNIPSPGYHPLRAVGSLIAGVVFAIGAWFTLKYKPEPATPEATTARVPEHQ